MSPSAPTTSPADDLYKKMAVAATVFAVVFEAGYLLTSAPPYDGFGYLIGRDYVSTWMGAHSAFAGGPAAWFDFDTYNAALAARFNPEFPHHSWSYPPHLLLMIWPLAFLPYLPAYLVWCALGMALYLLVSSEGGAGTAVHARCRAGRLDQHLYRSERLSDLGADDRRPRPARPPPDPVGNLLRPSHHQAAARPAASGDAGAHGAILAAIATTAVLVVATGLIFGFEIWPEYFRMVPPVLSSMLTEGQGLFTIMMPTIFMNARIAHLPLDVAWALQIAMSLAAVAAVVWTYWRRRDPVLSVALFVTATFLVTPYAFNYDMVVFGWVIALLREKGGAPLDDRLAMAVWTLPVTAMLLGLFGIPGSAAVLAAFAGRLLWRLKKAGQPLSAVQPPAPSPAPDAAPAAPVICGPIRAG